MQKKIEGWERLHKQTTAAGASLAACARRNVRTHRGSAGGRLAKALGSWRIMCLLIATQEPRCRPVGAWR